MHQVRHQVVRRFGTEQDAKLTVAVEVASHFTPPTDSVTCSWLQQQRARLIHQGMMAAPAESFFIRSPAHSLLVLSSFLWIASSRLRLHRRVFANFDDHRVDR